MLCTVIIKTLSLLILLILLMLLMLCYTQFIIDNNFFLLFGCCYLSNFIFNLFSVLNIIIIVHIISSDITVVMELVALLTTYPKVVSLVVIDAVVCWVISYEYIHIYIYFYVCDNRARLSLYKKPISSCSILQFISPMRRILYFSSYF